MSRGWDLPPFRRHHPLAGRCSSRWTGTGRSSPARSPSVGRAGL